VAATILSSSVALAGPVTVEVQQWKPNLDSSLKWEGDTIDLKDTLGMGDKNITNLAVKWDQGKTRTSIQYFQTKYSGNKVVSVPFTFQNQPYIVNTPVQSALKINMFQGSFENVIRRTEKSSLAMIYDIKVMKFDASIQNATTYEAKSATVPIPSIGLSYQLAPTKKLSYTAKATALPLGSRGHAYDVDLGMKFKAEENINLTLGYRLLDIKGQDNDNFIKLKMSGLYYGLEGKF